LIANGAGGFFVNNGLGLVRAANGGFFASNGQLVASGANGAGFFVNGANGVQFTAGALPVGIDANGFIINN